MKNITMEPEAKFCKKCGLSKPFADFPDSKGTKDGKFADCRECKSAYHAAYYRAHQDVLIEYAHKYYADNIEHHRQKAKEKRDKPEYKAHMSSYRKKYREDNLAEIAAENHLYYASNKVRILAREKTKRALQPELLLLRNAKARASESGVPFSIEKDDIVTPDVCPILDIRLETGTGVLHDGSPTLDKIVPELGYVRGNIAVISHRANTIKNCGTAEEHRLIADWMDGKYEIEFVTHPADRKHAKALVDHARKRAKKRGLPFEIGQKHIQVPDVCPALGIPLKRGVGRMCDSSPSVDRVIPELGYVPENIAIISLRANQIKSYGTAEEHRKVADWMDAQLEVLAA